MRLFQVFLLIFFLAFQGCKWFDNILEDEGTGGIRPPIPLGMDGAPAWSPDGSTIAYVGSNRTEAETTGIWLIDPDGSNRRFLVGWSDHPEWSPDGNWIAMNSIGSGILYKVEVATGSVVRLTSDDQKRWYPSWSPDGEKIAYSTHVGEPRGVWIMDCDGRNHKFLVTDALNPDWSPDGRIVFEGFNEQQTPVIMVIDTSGSNMRVLFDPRRHGLDQAASPSLSSDGSKVLFDAWREGIEPQVWVINVDGTNSKRIANQAQYPDWSPDGREIVYEKYTWKRPTPPGNGYLWIMDDDGSNQRQLTF
jgi:Tol biopolymer transport system component